MRRHFRREIQFYPAFAMMVGTPEIQRNFASFGPRRVCTMYRIYLFQSFSEEFGLTHDTAYNQLKSASEKLWNRYIRYIVQTRRGPKEAKFRWISGVTYHHGEGWVELNFT